MPLTKTQIKELKEQLSQQIQHLPQTQKIQAQKQIDKMSDKAIEEMVKQQTQQPIFRMIIEKKLPSTKIGENQDAVAVLSTRAISKGHTLIIPKKPAKTPKEIPKTAFKLAEQLSEKITKNLKTKEVRAETQTAFGEAIINLIPIYNHPLTINSPTEEKTPEQLQETKKKIEKISVDKLKPKKIKAVKKFAKPKPIKLPPRIP